MSDASKLKILITGGGGMLAHALAQTFYAFGVDHKLMSRAELDITKIDDILKVLDAEKPTHLINCAAYTKVDQAEKEPGQAVEINGKSVGNLADACKRRNIKLVHYSTDYVFADGDRTPRKIDDPLRPKGAYGVSKLLGERMIAEINPPGWILIRTAWLYGPNGPNFVQTMLNAARAGKPLKVIQDQTGSPTYTFDLASATLELIRANASGTFHLTNSGETNWFEFTRAIMDEFGITPTSLTPITSADWQTIKPDSAARPSYSVLDLSDYTRATGFKMPDWRDGLKRYHARIDSVAASVSIPVSSPEASADSQTSRPASRKRR